MRTLKEPSLAERFRKLAAVFCLFGPAVAHVGCSSPVEQCGGHFTVDPDLYARRADEFARAQLRWNTFATRQTSFAPGYGARCHVLPGKVEPKAAVYDHDAGLIVIDEDSENAQTAFESTLLHELGHSFGMGHVAGPGIMHDPQGTDFTPDDLTECRAANACYVTSAPLP